MGKKHVLISGHKQRKFFMRKTKTLSGYYFVLMSGNRSLLTWRLISLFTKKYPDHIPVFYGVAVNLHWQSYKHPRSFWQVCKTSTSAKMYKSANYSYTFSGVNTDWAIGASHNLSPPLCCMSRAICVRIKEPTPKALFSLWVCSTCAQRALTVRPSINYSCSNPSVYDRTVC
jgi:hypothetical protein